MSAFSCIFMETHLAAGASSINMTCLHVPYTPVWNPQAAQYQTAQWVREHYPRYEGLCSQCQQRVIIYASLDHANAGGWFMKP